MYNSRCFFGCILLLCASALFADPRDSVALVECEPNNAFIESFSLISGRFEESGNSDAADYFASLQKGWHGSGFLFQSENGDLALVTNRHVIKYSESIEVRFRSVFGKEQVFTGNFEIIEDPILDLAVITIPAAVEFSPFLPADKDQIQDGIQVYAAGYPGLMGEPLWQLSQGTVTNQRVEIDELIDPDLGYLIQHSASIDPGSSGGPLLIDEGDGIYRALGINTWSVGGRHNTFFAIPASQISRLLERQKEIQAHNSDSVWIESDLQEELDAILLLLGSDQWDFTEDHPYISTVLAAEDGWDSYLRLVEKISTREKASDSDETNRRVESLSPYDVLRESTAWAMWDSFRSQLGTQDFEFIGFSSTPDFLEEGSSAEGAIRIGNRELKLRMIFERGYWRIRSLEKLFEQKPVKADYGSGKRTAAKFFNEEMSIYGADLNPSFMNASYEGSAPISGIHGFYEFRVPKNQFFSYGWGLSLGYYNLSFDAFDGTDDIQYFGVSVPMNLYLRYPMGDNKKEFVPYLGAGAAFDVYSSLFSDSDDDLSDDGLGSVFALVPRIGFGCDYLFPAKGWGIGASLWKRFTLGSISFSLGDADMPEVDDLSLRLYLLFRY